MADNNQPLQMPDNIDLLLRKFVKGNINRQQLSELSTWVHESEANRLYAANLIELLFTNNVVTDKSRYDVEAAIARFHDAIGTAILNEEEERKILSNHTYIKYIKWFVRIAAIILVISLPLIGYFTGRNHVENKFADIVVQAPAGSQITTILPDGSRVDLNADSRLIYSQGFGIENRTVRLEGEGLFYIRHHEDKPFIVKTDRMVVTDIGTTFMAHNYKDECIATVDLVEGSVDVSNTLTPTTYCRMKPGQRINVNKLTGEIRRYRNEVSILNTNINSLNFIDMPMADIARQLSRSYGVKIEVAKDADSIKFYGFFNRREHSLTTILNAMSKTGLVGYTFKNGKYTIYKSIYANQ